VVMGLNRFDAQRFDFRGELELMKVDLESLNFRSVGEISKRLHQFVE
jgi:hypothetical protein